MAFKIHGLVYWSAQFLKDFSYQFMGRDKGNRNVSGGWIKEKKVLLHSIYSVIFLNATLKC